MHLYLYWELPVIPTAVFSDRALILIQKFFFEHAFYLARVTLESVV